MKRLIVVVEGQTEEAFVREVVCPHLQALGLYDVSATIVGKITAQRRGHNNRGGGSYKHWRKDIQRILQAPSPDLRVTTLFDLYGLPDDFPDLETHKTDTDTNNRCTALQEALRRDINDARFIPYLQRHEFEALVLASLGSLRELLDAQDDLDGVDALAREIAETPPEEINDGRETAPSKRLDAHIPSYRKTLHGPLATADTGLELIRQTCPRFGAWLDALEQLYKGILDE
jgi:hypothetical protein